MCLPTLLNLTNICLNSKRVPTEFYSRKKYRKIGFEKSTEFKSHGRGSGSASKNCIRRQPPDIYMLSSANSYLNMCALSEMWSESDWIFSGITNIFFTIFSYYYYHINTFVKNSFCMMIKFYPDEVYGDSAEGSIPKTESSPLNPTNPYAASKAACEMLIISYHVCSV